MLVVEKEEITEHEGDTQRRRTNEEKGEEEDKTEETKSKRDADSCKFTG